MSDEKYMDVDPRPSLTLQAAQFTEYAVAESSSSPSPKTVRLPVPTRAAETMEGPKILMI
jgi:hypothetical protein